MKLYHELKPRYQRFVDDLISLYPELTNSIVINRDTIVKYKNTVNPSTGKLYPHPTFITSIKVGYRGVYFFPNPSLISLPTQEDIDSAVLMLCEANEFHQELVEAGLIA